VLIIPGSLTSRGQKGNGHYFFPDILYSNKPGLQNSFNVLNLASFQVQESCNAHLQDIANNGSVSPRYANYLPFKKMLQVS
jgi:hypothetical protein